MTYVNRFERINESLQVNDLVDWMYTRGIAGESEQLWNLLKDKILLSSDINGNPNVSAWCQSIYNQLVPNKHKQRGSTGKLLTCQSAGREGEPYAVMICSLQRWLKRNPKYAIDKMNEDNSRAKPRS